MATDETKTPGDASANDASASDASASDASANDAHVPAPPPAPQGHGHGHDHDHDHDGPEAPPPGVRLMGGLRWGLVIGMAVVAFLSFWFLLAPPKHDGKKYTCPMVEHAFVVADEAGECPLCHMKLVPMEASVVEARKAGSAPSSEVPGVAPIALHLDRAQHAGVRTELVTSRELSPLVRAAAQVAVPEQGESHVHVRAPGFVERVAVREVGVSVGAGQPLAYVYSPDVYRAEEELLLAKRLAGGTGGGGPTVDAMRKRLVLLGMTERDVDDVLAKDTPARLIAVRAPAAGIVTRKDTALGAYVTPETVLYTVVDLSAAYVVAELPARDLPLAPRGTVGRLRLANAMAEVPVAVDLVYPEISPAARTARVRLRVVKQAGQKPVVLRPGQACEVVFDAGRRRALVVPRDALVDTGLSRYVFVDEGEGKLSPRAVVIGREESEALEIVSGLREGERVVVGATFLIDSESRMHAALAGVATPAASSSAPAASSAPASPPAPPGSPPTAPPAPPAPHGHAHGAHP